MEKSKTHIYFMPGLAAGPEIFEKLSFDTNRFELHYLKWLLPLNNSESISEYAERMCKEIHHDHPVLVGVSFGGILVQEMAKIISCQRVIIISSVKSYKEFPNNIRFAKKSNVHKLFPVGIIADFEKYTKFFVGEKLKSRAKMYQRYLSVRDKEYIRWALDTVVNWQQELPNKEVIHIHGTKDHIFPFHNIKDCIPIESGTHAMILIKAKQISKIISDQLA